MDIQKLDGTCSTAQLWYVLEKDLDCKNANEFKERIRKAFRNNNIGLRNLIYFTNFTSIHDRFLLWRLGFKKIGSYYNSNYRKVNIMFYSVKNLE